MFLSAKTALNPFGFINVCCGVVFPFIVVVFFCMNLSGVYD